MKVLFVNLKVFEKLPVYDPISSHGVTYLVGVHGFKGSGVQGSILAPGLHLGCVFTRKVSVSVRPNPKFGAKLAITWENEHL